MTPFRTPHLVLLALVLALGAASGAFADEIIYRDADTCEEKTLPSVSVVSETWTEVKYKDQARGPEKSVPSALVIDVKREATGAQTKELLKAISELEHGSVTEARRQLETLSGGGYRQDLDSGKLEYKDFTANDPPGRRKRPQWTAEYAHFFYAKALFLDGMQKKDPDLLLQAYLALVDQDIPDGKGRTGGFLKRFSGGNSRYYPEAMVLAAQALVGMKRYKEAEKAFSNLGDQSIAVDMGPRWAYEAKLGPGLIAEAQGKYLDAENAYKDAANFMRLLLKNEVRGCFRRELGRLHSRARMKAAGVMLEQAEKSKSPPLFRKLREFINKSTPESLSNSLRGMTQAQREALIEGARDPEAQAVMQNGLGLAYLQEGKFEDAILAFRSVEVKYFQVPEEHARALYYLARAADQAAGKASGDAKALYESYRDEAQKRLKADYPDSTWAR